MSEDKLLDFYFLQQQHYTSTYGKATILLINKGKFYECFQYDDNGHAIEFARILNMQLSRVNKKKNENPSKDNPYMAGFPTTHLHKHLPLLLEQQYTVVVIDEDSEIPSKRAVSCIYSPGTYIETNKISNYMLCIYVDNRKDEDTFIGITSVDLSTGEVYLYEINNGSSHLRIEECYRIIESINPSEIVIVSVKELSNLYKNVCNEKNRKVTYRKFDSCIDKIAFQNSIFREIYEIKTQLTPIEYFDLELCQMASYSFAFLIRYCCAQNKAIVHKLQKPIFENFQNKMIIHNNSIYQLNVVNFSNDKSLLNVVDFTSTSMGKRLLRKLLLNPSCDPLFLQQSYDQIEKMIPVYEQYEEKLKKIVDVQKLHRKIGLSTLKINELRCLIDSYDSLQWILKNYNVCFYNEFEQYVLFIHNTFIVENLSIEQNDSVHNIFQNAFDQHCSSMFAQIDEINHMLQNICNKINTFLQGNASVQFENDCIYTTHNRCKKIKMQTNEYVYTIEKNKAIIQNEEILTLFHKKNKLVSEIKPYIENKFVEIQTFMYTNFHHLMLNIHETVAEIDVITSKAKCAIMHNYSKPIICNNQFLQLNNMRHPIIEQLNNDTNYDPCNVLFDDKKCGMLLYGVNGAGKSSYNKSIGLNIVLAQSGHYVAADLIKFRPYERLYTRLGDADNIYKGQSSFFVEVTELKSILHYANDKSLIIGDEPCRGTENNSAVTIVSFTLKWLLERNSTFIFATHFHQLTDIACIKSHPKLMLKHVAIDYENDNTIVYTHEIKDGKCKRNYGLEIAKKVINLKIFDEQTELIFNEVTRKNSNQVSRYNSKLLLKQCEICQSEINLQTHHIVYQQHYNKKSVMKNLTGNLVVLCEEHHNMIHSNKLIVHGWKKTDNGKSLNYTFI